ncbi:glycine zipper 2TM domain-containing protein [Sphingomicrobium astaxanthinifaciens]|uniref:glycine zipper 2TM domain-containing protein n=1 Tax=Sphingomicrobium astaxanthinifaciens TaxID=1227949 RepID=UPI001FCB0C06|nr:glycine zipper 2TM domain-containing protein [Sphingomicrobium astaxanthinifaciens]MCJ7421852.1 glycine zipper 2TM domain-containing protein [Sphingomicrobium astaxanthinifaciens]
MSRLTIMLVATSLVAPSLAPTPALAHPKRHHHGHQRIAGYDGDVWLDQRGRYRCKKSDGTTGLIVGAAGGVLLGRAIDSEGDRTTGTIVGAAAGALLGKAIDQKVVNRNSYRCR